MIIITFDDAVNAENFELYSSESSSNYCGGIQFLSIILLQTYPLYLYECVDLTPNNNFGKDQVK